jgi:hypothetical protein
LRDAHSRPWCGLRDLLGQVDPRYEPRRTPRRTFTKSPVHPEPELPALSRPVCAEPTRYGPERWARASRPFVRLTTAWAPEGVVEPRSYASYPALSALVARADTCVPTERLEGIGLICAFFPNSTSAPVGTLAPLDGGGFEPPILLAHSAEARHQETLVSPSPLPVVISSRDYL